MSHATPESIQLWGGTVALDFVNTVDWTDDYEYAAPEQSDVLAEGLLLTRWGRRLRLLAGAPRPPVDAAELARARELRDALYRALATIACDAAPRPDDLRVIASTHAEAMAAAELAPSGAAWGWEWGARDPRRVRFAVAVDAVRLLEDGDRLARVTRCPGRHCGWLFINASGRRRWCSMTTCGSREKMRRMYRRRRPSSKS
jgi:predicted RNA-binding Zn ribbon-like protein